MTKSGSGCGDLDVNAPNQRFDASGCSGTLEYSSGAGKGVSGKATFASDGTLPSTDLTLGTQTASCTGTATATTIQLTCAGEAGTCTISMTYTGPL